MKTFCRLFAVAALIVCASYWSGTQMTAQEKDKVEKDKDKAAMPVPVTKWEYKVATLGNLDDKIEKELNKFGEEGWELIGTPSVVSSRGINAGVGGAVSTEVKMIFKRPKK